ncbi:hypothetical protein SLA2020_256930 [Shorea laevis]
MISLLFQPSHKAICLHNSSTFHKLTIEDDIHVMDLKTSIVSAFMWLASEDEGSSLEPQIYDKISFERGSFTNRALIKDVSEGQRYIR